MEGFKIRDGIPRKLVITVDIQGGPKPDTDKIESAVRGYFKKQKYLVHRTTVEIREVPLHLASRRGGAR